MTTKGLAKAIREIDGTIGSSSRELRAKRNARLFEKSEHNTRQTVEELKKLENIIPIDVREELKEIRQAVENIKIPNKEKRLKAIENVLIEILAKDSDEDINRIMNEIKGTVVSDRKNTERIIRTLRKELRAIKPNDYTIALDKVIKRLEQLLIDSNKTKKVEITNFPEYPKVDINPIVRSVRKLKDILKKTLSIFVENTDKDEAIPVRLVTADKRNYYNAQFSGGGGGGIDVPDPIGINGYNGTSWRAAGLDETTRSLTAIEYEHHEIHDGDSFYAEIYDATLDTGNVLIMLITTPNTLEYAHMRTMIQVSNAATVLFYEGTTVLAEGGAVTENNRDRNSAHSATVVVTEKPTITANGTLLQTSYVGTAGKYGVGGTDSALNEWILKANEKYLLVLTSRADGNLGVVGINWYEHTNLAA